MELPGVLWLIEPDEDDVAAGHGVAEQPQAHHGILEQREELEEIRGRHVWRNSRDAHRGELHILQSRHLLVRPEQVDDPGRHLSVPCKEIYL